MTLKKLFIIDAMAMIFRNYHGYHHRDLENSTKSPTSAIYGCALNLLRLIENEKPDYIAIASDTQKRNFRHDLYPLYKAKRKETPKELLIQLPLIYQMFNLFNCLTIKKIGFEADDIIGTLHKKCKHTTIHCYIVSGDKDFLQLVDEKTTLYSIQKGNTIRKINPRGVFEKFSCQPTQIVDLLSLWGDASDNLPGIPGIGEQGAKKLLLQFGSLDNIYHHINEITNKRQKDALTKHKELAILTKKLVSIKTDVEIRYTLEDLTFDYTTAIANKPLQQFFKKLNLHQLANHISLNINNKRKDPPSSNNNPFTEKKYQLLHDAEKIHKFFQNLHTKKKLSFALTTKNTSLKENSLIGISFYTDDNKAYYLPLSQTYFATHLLTKIKTELKKMFSNRHLQKISHNITPYIPLLKLNNLYLEKPYDDTMIASLLLSESSLHDMTYLSKKYFNLNKITTNDLIQQTTNKTIMEVDIDVLSYYACEDAHYCFHLNDLLTKKLQNKNLMNLYRNKLSTTDEGVSIAT